MVIVGFTFTKVAAKREKLSGSLSVNNNITLVNVEDAKLALADTNQTSLHYTFKFTSQYNNNTQQEIGLIELEGYVASMVEKEEAKKILQQWKKEKKLDNKLLEVIINYALERCNIEAILLSKEVGLPAPLKLPRIASKEE
ncbi:MAG: hypothetical protein QW594_03905 [Candidatus Woesearchaeota archaeon]